MKINPEDITAAFDLEPEEAEKYLRNKGYNITWSWREMQNDAHRRAFTVAKAMKKDVLMAIRGSVDAAIAKGTTFEQFRKDLEPQLRAKGWWGQEKRMNPTTGKMETVQLGSPWRLENIYRTNLQSAYMAGRQLQQQAVAGERPYWQFIGVGDGRSTDVCASQNGKVYRADDAIWGRLYPPNHYRCRSRVRTLSEKQLKREDLSVIDGSNSEWQPAAGFATSPIVHWTPDLTGVPKPLAKQVQTDLDALDEEVGLQYARRDNVKDARKWTEDHVTESLTFTNPMRVKIEDEAQLEAINQVNEEYARLSRLNPNLGKLKTLTMTAGGPGDGSGGQYMFKPTTPDELGEMELFYIPNLTWLDTYRRHVDGQVKKGLWFKVSRELGDSFRHEWGHHIHALTFDATKDYSARIVPDVWKTEPEMQGELSIYSNTRYPRIMADQWVEAVAEGVTLITSDRYTMGTLPKDFENWLFSLVRGEFQ